VADPDPFPSSARRLALIGPGRAGGAVTGALVAQGWRVTGVAGRAVDAPGARAAAARFGAPARTPREAAADADLVIVATPDRAIDTVAEAIATAVSPDALVVHLSGARGVDALARVPARRGALHPLQSLPDADVGRARLAGSYAAVAGDGAVEALARSIGLIPFRVPDAERVGYHAAACIASNHLVALLAQVTACTDVPLDAFMPLVRATLDNVHDLGVRAALTGPVARGDAATVAAHLDAIPAEEREAYVALARRAAALAGRASDLAEVLGPPHQPGCRGPASAAAPDRPAPQAQEQEQHR
jgi:predicted short-subunit dehydrogenase-like oxidoreductase (DUF2520 family)